MAAIVIFEIKLNLTLNISKLSGIFVLMRFVKYLIWICLLGGQLFAQKESYNWYFGIGAGITFNPSGNPSALLNSAMISGKGCASISDSCTGQLYFYTNGDSIINRNHQTMLNGTNLDGSSGSTQSAIIVPSPDASSGKYYVFTVERNNGLKYSIVDMNLAGGLGGVMPSKKNIALVSPTVEKVTAVRHQQNKKIWILTHKVNSDEFYAYLLTDTGLNTTPVISTVGQTYGTGSQLGYMKASPRGNKIALALSGDKRFDVFDFDNANGSVSNPKSTGNFYNFAYGLEFSPDGSKLYVTSNLGMHQYNLNSALPGKPLGDSVFLGTAPTVALQLGPDGIIYCNEGYFLGAITKPNASGTSCQYVPNSLNLSGKFSSSGLPTFMQSYFSPVFIIEEGICLGIPTDFNISSDRAIDSIRWNFGDPASGTSNSSILRNPSHFYNDTGTYQVTAYVFSKKCNVSKADTIQKNIKIIDLPIPNIDLGNDTSICQGDTLTLWTDGLEPSYVWSDGSNGSQIKAFSEGTYWVKATNTCGSLTDSVKINYFESSLLVDLGKDTSLCRGSVMNFNIRNDGATYLWSTGATSSEILINSSGVYWGTAYDLCTYQSDTVKVSSKDRPIVRLGADTIICNGSPLILQAYYPNSIYQWNDFSEESTLEVTKEGSYRVRVINDCGSASDGIYVRTKDCECFVYLPNTITPNNDQLNDALSVYYSCEFKDFKLEIYNRWDERIYATSNPNATWDATLNDKPLPSGIYFYLIKYTSNDPKDDDEHEIRGMLTVLK